MRLRINVAANLIGAAVAAGAAVFSAPLIYRWLGSEAYGLVGVYVLLQTLMPLFDSGITAGLARAVAWHRGRGAIGEILTLVRVAERPLMVLALVFFFVALLGAGAVARHWLGQSVLPFASVRLVLWLMAGALAVRMLAALQRATLMALELQVEANIVQTAAAIARTFGALLVAYATDTGVVGFFAVQGPISLAEWWCYRGSVRRALAVEALPVAPEDLAHHLRFAFGIAGLSALWLLASQADKALLADRLSLPAYGAYSLGVHIAAVILLAVGTVHGAVLPRMTRHFSSGELTEARTLYNLATAMTVAFSCAVVVAIIIGGPRLMPSLSIGEDGIDPLRIAWVYGIGNSGVALLALAYQLQNARGVLRIHVWGTALQAIVQIPLIAWAASTGDALRTALAFATVNWLFVLGWIPVVHKRFLPGGHVGWLSKHLLPPVSAGAGLGIAAIAIARQMPGGVAWGLIGVAAGAGATFAGALAAEPDARQVLREWIVAHVR